MQIRRSTLPLSLFMVVIVGLSAFAPSVALAQSDVEVKLNRQAVDAMTAGEYDKAITLFRALLDMNELNIVYLNLGRALTRAGQCDEAKAAFDKVPEAPAVEAPPREAVLAKLEEYRGLLATECPGTVELACTPVEIKISVDGGAEQACSGVLSLAPGEHQIVSLLGDTKEEHSVTVVSGQASKLAIDMAVTAAPDRQSAVPDPQPGPDPAAAEGGSSPLAWIVLGTGAASLAGAAFVDVVVLGSSIDELKQAADENDSAWYDDVKGSAELQQYLVFGLTGVGITAVGVGAYLLLSDDVPPSPPKTAVRLRVVPWLAPDAAGVTTGLSF